MVIVDGIIQNNEGMIIFVCDKINEHYYVFLGQGFVIVLDRANSLFN